MISRFSRRTIRYALIGVFSLSTFLPLMSTGVALAESSTESIRLLQSLKTGDDSNIAATKALLQLQESTDITLIQSLTAMKGATPVGRNWILGFANSLHRKVGNSQNSELSKFLSDSTQDGEARYTAFQWLTAGNEPMRKALLSKMTQDLSPELRFLAIEEVLKEKLELKPLSALLDSARHPDQVVSIIGKLKELGEIVDQSKQFGFLQNWRLIGPFDNVGTVNFNKVFPVETDYLQGSLKEEYQGKTEVVKWKSETTNEPDGTVKLATIYSNEKGCIVYAYAEFVCEKEQDAEVRLGCINGNKTWVNGKLVMSNEVYHTGAQIDQYSESIRLKAGKNLILLKLSQNEQKEAWAQDFQFQLRICDSTGKAILEKGR